MLERWIGGVLKYRLSILTFWAIVIVLGSCASFTINNHLTTSLGVPGSGSAQADEILSKSFHENSEGTFTVFYTFKNGTKDEIAGFASQIEAAAKIIPSAKILQSKAVGGTLFTSIGTSFDLPRAASYTNALRSAIQDQGLAGALVTGPPAIKSDVTPVLARDLHRGEIVAIALGLLLLLLVLGFSWASIVPLIFASATITATLGIVFLLSHLMMMVLYIPNIVELIGLGLAIDYSLLIVQRFRREITVHETDDAILKTMQTAGRTIMTSGITVALGLATLLLVPIPFVRSLGIAGILVPAISLTATLTLQPVLLSYLGKAGVRTWGYSGLLGRKDVSTGIIAKSTRLVLKKPLLSFIGSSALLLLLVAPIFALHVTPSSLTAIPQNLESAKALKLVTGSAGSGAITPSEIVIDLGPTHRSIEVSEARQALVETLSKNSEVFLVASGEKSPYVDSTGRYLRMYVVGKHDLGAMQTQELVKSLRTEILSTHAFPAGTKIYLGGAPAQGLDLLHAIFSAFPLMALLIILLTYVLLYRAFKSAILPLKAIVLDLISIAVAMATVAAVFHFGIGSSIFGTYHLPQIEAWVLIFLFAILFGLSMDYEVFIVSRMREAWDRGESNESAIVEGMSHTGGVVTSAAAILIVAVSGLARGHFAGLQQLGIGLAFGILIDATIIRAILLPSAMALLGKWNWWQPSRKAHI